jgi:hypothetical protein
MILDSDGIEFGGSGALSRTVFPTQPVGAHGFDHSVTLDLPPLATLVLRLPVN